MVTTLKAYSLAGAAARNILPGENWRPEAYMSALRDSGFTGIRMEDIQHERINIQVIYATA